MTDDWETPNWIKNLFQDFDDPCPLNGNGGLEREWGVKTFVNPPYSKPLPWVEKAIRENKKGKYIVLLLKHDHSTRAFELLHNAGAHMLLINERLAFVGSSDKKASFPSTLFILEPGA